LGIIKAVMQAITGDWKGAWNTIKGVVATVLKAMKSNIDNVLTIIKGIIKLAWSAISGVTKATWEAIRKTVSDKIDAARNRAREVVDQLKAGLKTAWEDIKQAASSAWEAISGAIWRPIETAYDKVTEFIGKILGAINRVLDAVGLPTINLSGGTPSEKTQAEKGLGPGSPAAAASGGVYHPSGRLEGLKRMARGGIIAQHAVGGMADGRIPRAVYGEVGKAESYAVHGRRDNIPYAQAYAESVDMTLVPRRVDEDRHHPGGVPGFAEGGILGAWKALGVPMHAHGATMYSWAPGLREKWDAIARQVPGVTFNNYYGHPDGWEEREQYSADFWGPGGRGDPIGVPMGDATLQAGLGVLGDALSYFIWNGRASWGFNPTDPHRDHVHFTAMPGLDFGGGGGGGWLVSVPNPLQKLFENRWKAWIQPVVDTFLGPLKNANHVLTQAAGAAAQKIPDGIYKWIDEKIPDTIMGGSGSVSGDFSGSQAQVALGFAKNSVGRGMPGRLPVMTALQESGMRNLNYGHADSLGYFQQRPSQGWGTTEQIMDPAYALDKFLDAAEPYKGDYTNSPTGLGSWAQAVQRSAFPGRYAGQWDAAAQLIGDPQFYDTGAFIKKEHAGVLHPNEIVLPLNNPGVMQTAQTALGTAELREEIADLKAALTDRGVRVSGYGEEARRVIVVGAREGGLGAIGSNDGRKLIKAQGNVTRKLERISGGSA
ncbi:MAG: hypothetical protein M3P49_10720, partial [Actinomycetota bacterium]|nr:hypothetical protein [Actinomycetota bacterium]